MNKNNIILSISILLGCLIIGVSFYLSHVEQTKSKMLAEKNAATLNTNKRNLCLKNVEINISGGDGNISHADYLKGLEERNNCYIKFPE